jgi:hypothetical protein
MRRLSRSFFAKRQLCIMSGSKGDSDARSRMLNDIQSGASSGAVNGAAGSLLVRGCDPVMAERAKPMISNCLGPGVEIVSSTEDSDFFQKLQSQKWSCVMFAPGACRYNAAKRQIPGSSSAIGTAHWGLDQYRQKVRELQGDSCKIVETADEREVMSVLRAAFRI